MTPAARLQAIIDLLSDPSFDTVRPDALLKSYFRQRRYAGSADRRSVAADFYTLCRRHARLDWWIEWTEHATTPRSRLLAHLILDRKLSMADIDLVFNGTQYAPEVLDADERQLAGALAGKSLIHDAMPDWIRLEVPYWSESLFRDQLGNRLDAELTALNEPAPVDVRVNTMKADREQALKALADEGIEADPTRHSPHGLRMTGHKPVTNTQAFKDGWLEVQDEGSQIVALLTDAQPGMTVADVCAGAGGKTLALAAALQGSGRVYACDNSSVRLNRMDERLRRAGPGNVRKHVFGGDEDTWSQDHQGALDRVLVDAPCSGTGAWRRDLMARWRLTPDEVTYAETLQRRILAASAPLVKPGGRLIYATCSLLASENEVQATRFLEDHPEFRAHDIREIWIESVSGKCPSEGPYLHLTPHSTGTDGYFIAVFERVGG